MKKLLILPAVGVILATPADAVQRCVALDVNGVFYSRYDKYDEVDWFIESASKNIRVYGIAICGTNGATNMGDVSSDVSYGVIARQQADTHCWCKMIRPFVSKWIYGQDFGDADSCALVCSSFCSSFAADDIGFRTALFSNLEV